MAGTLDNLEKFWAAILSEDDAEIRNAWQALDAEQRAALRDHLEQMIADDEFTDGQRQAARAALRVIGPEP